MRGYGGFEENTTKASPNKGMSRNSRAEKVPEQRHCPCSQMHWPFKEKPEMVSIFSCVFWPFEFLLLRKFCLVHLPISLLVH
jgi:hypothetical protein